MINKRIKDYCCDDISLIENYDEAICSDEMYDCHHRLEILPDGTQVSIKELIDKGLYLKRPASELILLTRKEHNSLHKKGVKPWNKGISSCRYKWLLPNNEIRIMDKLNAHKHHPDWIEIGEA